MVDAVRSIFLWSAGGFYRLIRPLLFLRSPQSAHHDVLRLLALLDRLPPAIWLLHGINRLAFRPQPVTVGGGVRLPYPFVLAAGFVKGRGFATDTEALHAATSGETLMPGWRAMPALVGPVEFGSFTPHACMGNPGTVMWRDPASRSTQNRVGLKNPGAQAAAKYLGDRKRYLPPVFGINIAPSPGIADRQQEIDEVVTSIHAFIDAGVRPSWFTLNLSCPNTEDDPGSRQTGEHARGLCTAIMDTIAAAAGQPVPLWVKVGPDLADTQYAVLMQTFAETGVHAVVATNTLPCPAPNNESVAAGVGGGRLHDHALSAAAKLKMESDRLGCDVDVIGCGGVMDGATLRAYREHGIAAVQYWSALVYRGPLAAAIIAREAEYV